MQACLERLDLDTALQDEEKAQALNTLSRHFLDRVCQGDGHMYLGEQVVRCYHGRASDEVIFFRTGKNRAGKLLIPFRLLQIAC